MRWWLSSKCLPTTRFRERRLGAGYEMTAAVGRLVVQWRGHLRGVREGLCPCHSQCHRRCPADHGLARGAPRYPGGEIAGVVTALPFLSHSPDDAPICHSVAHTLGVLLREGATLPANLSHVSDETVRTKVLGFRVTPEYRRDVHAELEAIRSEYGIGKHHLTRILLDAFRDSLIPEVRDRACRATGNGVTN